jgi:transcriptional accessory protein Tex/SPT6
MPGSDVRRSNNTVGQELSTLNIPPRKVVKTLTVGQEVDGVVKRVTDFGAFVDIGVGRDGLVHVSEMSPTRVARASDMVKEGEKVKVWVKELDREKNRISLSMIEPGTKTLRDLEEGDVLPGRVTRLERYGAFVDLGVGRDGMLHVKEMGRGFVEKPEDVVKIGDELQVKVVGIDRRRGRVDLSIKDLLPPEPDAPVAAIADVAAPAGEDGWLQDEAFITPFELAFQEAGKNNDRRREKRSKKSRTWDYDEEDDVIQRTIAHHRKNRGDY